MKDTSTLRSQILFLVTVLLPGLQSVAVPTIILAAEQEMPRRHSLIYRSAVESTALPATIQGIMLQPPSAEPTRITDPIEPPKTSTSPPTMPLMHHRSLAKRPAITSTTAPPTTSQPLSTALTSGVASGQVAQTTADTAKSTPPTATAPVTKSTATPFPGATSTGTATAAPRSSTVSPFANAAGVRPVASTGSGSVPSSSGSRSALNLLQNSAIASLLQPPTPVVSTPPSTPPPSPSTGNVTLSWMANGESDLAGYKIYVGTASGAYNFPGSPFVIGKVTSYTVSNLPNGQTYSFAMSAYDSAGNESPLSAEVSKTLY